MFVVNSEWQMHDHLWPIQVSSTCMDRKVRHYQRQEASMFKSGARHLRDAVDVAVKMMYLHVFLISNKEFL